MQIEADDCKYCWRLQQLSDGYKYNLTVTTNIYTKIILRYVESSVRTKGTRKDIIILIRTYIRVVFNICTGTKLEEDTTASVRGSKKGGTE